MQVRKLSQQCMESNKYVFVNYSSILNLSCNTMNYKIHIIIII